MNVRQDEKNTHIDWELNGVTAHMLDWFWANMEKGFYLWHPIEHHEFYWAVPPEEDNIVGSVHVAPQTWGDGQRIEPHIRIEDLATLRKEILDIIVYDHAVVVGAISLTKKDYKPENPVIAYRVHQYESSDLGVRGMSSCVNETLEKGMVWSKHASEEVGYWGDFLPQMYQLYRVIDNPKVCPFMSLKVERTGDTVRYVAGK